MHQKRLTLGMCIDNCRLAENLKKNKELLYSLLVFHILNITLTRRSHRVNMKADKSGHFFQHTQEKVHLLIQLAESMLAKGHAHRTELRRCVSTVDKRYRDFTVRMGQYRHLLDTALGSSSQVKRKTERDVQALKL